MRKVIVNEFLALDGTAQAPGGPDEDTSGGFQHGGWQMQYGTGSGVENLIDEAGGFLLGRRTYEIFAGYWPNAPEHVQDIAVPMNAKPKHVASRTLTGPLGWQNSSVLPGPLPEAACRTQGGRRRRPARDRQHRARAIVDPARPRRRAPPHDQSSLGRRWEADLPGRRCASAATARRSRGERRIDHRDLCTCLVSPRSRRSRHRK